MKTLTGALLFLAFQQLTVTDGLAVSPSASPSPRNSAAVTRTSAPSPTISITATRAPTTAASPSRTPLATVPPTTRPNTPTPQTPTPRPETPTHRPSTPTPYTTVTAVASTVAMTATAAPTPTRGPCASAADGYSCTASGCDGFCYGGNCVSCPQSGQCLAACGEVTGATTCLNVNSPAGTSCTANGHAGNCDDAGNCVEHTPTPTATPSDCVDSGVQGPCSSGQLCCPEADGSITCQSVTSANCPEDEQCAGYLPNPPCPCIRYAKEITVHCTTTAGQSGHCDGRDGSGTCVASGS